MPATATTRHVPAEGSPRRVPVTVRLASGVEITGDVHLPTEDWSSQVPDLLERGRAQYLPITDATMVRPDGGRTATDCVIVRRQQIEAIASLAEGNVRLLGGTTCRDAADRDSVESFRAAF